MRSGKSTVSYGGARRIPAELRGIVAAGIREAHHGVILNYLAAAAVRMQMPDIESQIELVRLLPPGQGTDAVRKLKSVLAVVVVQDPKQWDSYNVKPLTFVNRPQSPFYPEMEKAVGANLEYIISTQKSDGGWGLTWSWEDRNPTAWKLAEKEWRGVVSLENLQTLQASHRIAQ